MTKAILRRMLVSVLMGAATTAMADAINYSDGQVHDLTAGDADTTDSIALSAKSTLNLNGGTLTDLTGSIQLSGNSVLSVNNGANLLRGVDTAAAKTVLVSNSKLRIDGGTVTVPAGNHNSVGNGTTHLDSGTIEVDNGGSFTVSGGRSSFVLKGASTVLVNNGSTFSLVDGGAPVELLRSWAFDGSGSIVAVTNSTFKFIRCCIAGNNQGNLICTKAKLLFHNSTVTSSADNSYNRAFYFYKSTYGCSENLIRFSGAQSSIGTIGFEWAAGGTADMKNNRVEVLDIPSIGGRILVSAGNSNKYFQRNSIHKPDVFSVGGTSNEIEVEGGKFGNADGGSLTIGGKDCKVTFKDCNAWLSVYSKAGTPGVPLKISAGANGSSLVIDNSTLLLKGQVGLVNSNDNCAVVFKGAAPRMTFSVYGTMDAAYAFAVGSSNAALAGKTTALKFVLPTEPYADSVVENSMAKPIKIYPNAKFVIDQGDWTIGTDKTKTFYPLLKDNYAVGKVAHPFNDEMTAELVASLNANATLPEGAALEYDSAKKVLGVRMPREKLGMMLIVQ